MSRRTLVVFILVLLLVCLGVSACALVQAAPRMGDATRSAVARIETQIGRVWPGAPGDRQAGALPFTPTATPVGIAAVSGTPTPAPTSGRLARSTPRISTPTATPAASRGTAGQPGRNATVTPPAVTAAKMDQGDWYRLYFTRPFYPERPPDRVGGLDAALIADLDAAQTSIDMASFGIDLPSVVDALRRAAARGVRVRVVTDDDANNALPEAATATLAMRTGGIELSIDHSPGYSHNKVYIIDDQVLWTGSWNLTASDTYRNNNNALRVTEPRLIENYKKRFEELMAGRFHNAADKTVPNPKITLANGVSIENYFSPNGGARAAIQARLAAAQKNIRLLAFSYTAQRQADILVEKRKAGLPVQAVLESRNANGAGAQFSRLKSGGVDVLKDGNCYVMHDKVYIIDDKTVIMGSYNFTGQAETDNDENVLIIDDPNLAAHYIDEFNRIYKQAQNPTCGS